MEETRTFVLRSFTRDLPVKLTDVELQDRGERMGLLAGDLDNHDKHAQDVKATLKAQRAALEAEMSKLGLALRTKQETRPVMVREEADFEKGIAIQRRQDNGELVSGPGSTRPLRDDERQGDLLGNGKPLRAAEEPAEDDDAEPSAKPPRIRKARALPEGGAPPDDGDAAF